jgi:hypothetical protein
MSREIKFRAWDKSMKKMIHPKLWDNSMPSNWEHWYKLQQFTNNKDFTGKDIYVGDVLSDRWKVEVYQNYDGTFMVKFHTNPKGNKPITLNKYLKSRERAGTSICEGYRDCIVIGNIYENPELIP